MAYYEIETYRIFFYMLAPGSFSVDENDLRESIKVTGNVKFNRRQPL